MGIVKGGLRLHDNLRLARKLLVTVMTRKQDLQERIMEGVAYTLGTRLPPSGCQGGEGRELSGYCRGGRSSLSKKLKFPIEEAAGPTLSPSPWDLLPSNNSISTPTKLYMEVYISVLINRLRSWFRIG